MAGKWAMGIMMAEMAQACPWVDDYVSGNDERESRRMLTQTPLRKEALANTKIPAMVLVDVEEQKSIVKRALQGVLIPRRLISYAGIEGGII
jgi:hypothetical protein